MQKISLFRCLRERKWLVQNLIPAIPGIIIVLLVWTICSFAETAASTGQERVVGPSKIISVKSVRKNAKRLALCP